MQKIAENEARDEQARVLIENRDSVTVEIGDDRVVLSSEILVDDDGYSDGSVIDLNLSYEWASGRSITGEEKLFIRRKLTEASQVLDAGFRFRVEPG
jgi:hypothetical protein